jgi:hypothetical protein
MHHLSSTRVLTCFAAVLIAAKALAAEPLSDPTQPYGNHDAPRAPSIRTEKTLQLEAILHGAQRRVAIINGQLVHEGDRIDHNVIELITPTSVRYAANGQQHTLHLSIASLPATQLSIRPVAMTQLVKDGQP